MKTIAKFFDSDKYLETAAAQRQPKMIGQENNQ